MIVALDLETTGLDPKKDKIIEIALVKFDPKNFQIFAEYSTLIDPEIHIPELNSSITNIYDEDVRDAPKWGEILQKVSDFIGECPVLGHNVYFDTGFLQEKGISLEENTIIDTFLIANFLVLGEKSLSLEYLSSLFTIPLKGAHRALNDTKASIYVFEKLIQRLQKFPAYKTKVVSYIISKCDDSGLKFIHDRYLKKDYMCSTDEDFQKALGKIFPKAHKYQEIQKKANMEEYDFGRYLKTIGNKELRDTQEQMGNIVYDAVVSEKNTVIEAPTGIGKTYAYLIPSIYHSVKTGEQVFVSTSTKALQDQIYYKDLQLLSEKLPFDFSYSKLKGKRNYVGLSSFMSFLGDYSSYTRQQTSFILKILLWISKTANGELDELDYYGEEFSYLYKINADDVLTFSSENPYEEKEFAVRARRQSRSTNIVIINNNILFQDIAGENSILSKLENLVIDEAHNLEDVATKSLEKEFCLHDLQENFVSLERKLSKEKESIASVALKKEQILFEIGMTLDILMTYLLSKVGDTSSYKTCLIKEDFFEKHLGNVGEKEMLIKIQLQFTEYIDLLHSLDDALYKKISREIRYIEVTNDILQKVLDKKSIQSYMCILNYTEKKGIIVSYTHLHPGEYMKKYLWSKLSSCILTSATLESGEDFGYVKNILSLEDFSFHLLPTDFDYEKQALLFVPNDLGSVKNNFHFLLRFFFELIIAVRGNILFLFTSFYSIREMYTNLDKDLKKEGIHMYAQSIGGGKQKLIDFYKKNADSGVLIGTNTFWEGVDIPGDSLQYLVIHKIPFMVPTDPIFQGRSSLYKDPFSEYAIPKAVIKLKQGFGRLIRTKSDTGVVIFLDDRIYSTAWGEAIYKAFPTNIKRRIGSSKDFLRVLKQSKK